MVAIILNAYLEDVNKELGEQNLEIENKEKNIGDITLEEEKYSNLVRTLEERIDRYLHMSEFSLKLSTSFTDAKLYSFIMEYTKKLFPNSSLKLLTVAADQYDRWVLEKKSPLLVENAAKDYRFAIDGESDFISLIECPLFQENRVTGAIRIENNRKPFTPSELRVLNVASTLSSLALEKARLFRQTKELAITDDLTGLYTQTYFKERLDEEVKRAARYSENFTVLMMDIDNFKFFNDTYGHQSGDIVLKKVADTIRLNIRETDIIARYGGEEISVMLHSLAPQKAVTVAENIRKEVASKKFTFDNAEISVTITIGGASFPENPTPELLIGRADEALYKGKSRGKNRVEFSGEKS